MCAIYGEMLWQIYIDMFYMVYNKNRMPINVLLFI